MLSHERSEMWQHRVALFVSSFFRFFAMTTARDKTLRVRFSDDEFKALQERAAEAGLSMSELVRDHAGQLKVRNRKDEHMRNVTLNRINANLNMIAKWANTHKGAAEAVDVIAHLIALQREIGKLAK